MPTTCHRHRYYCGAPATPAAPYSSSGGSGSAHIQFFNRPAATGTPGATIASCTPGAYPFITGSHPG